MKLASWLLALSTLVGAPALADVPPDLVAAIHQTQPAAVSRALARGAHANADLGGGMTPLMLACTTGNAAIVRSVIAYGGNVNAVDRMGWTPLMYALNAETYADEVVMLLLRSGANPRARSNDGETALSLAEGHPGILGYLQHPPAARAFKARASFAFDDPSGCSVRFYVKTSKQPILESARWASQQINSVLGRRIAGIVSDDGHANESIKFVKDIDGSFERSSGARGSWQTLGYWTGKPWAYGDIYVISGLSGWELRKVLLHEMLHALGLDHNLDQFSVMYFATTNPALQGLTKVDKARLIEQFNKYGRE